MQTTNRRHWIKQASLAIAGIGFATESFGHAPKMMPPGPNIRLSANENPYGPSPFARKAMTDMVTLSNRYPFSDLTGQVRERIRKEHQLDKEHVLLGAGSSEILGLVAQLAASRQGNAVSANPTFGIWWTAAQRGGLNITKVPLTAGKGHDLPAMLAAINSDTRLVYVCNPNNPTGTITETMALKEFITTVSQQTMVLLDEAYIEYCDEPSLASMVASNKNIIVAKTFSKIYGMAGARIGYALAHPETIRQLGQFQPWENAGASRVSLAGALASLDDTAFVSDSKKWNAGAREYTRKELEKLNIRTIPSHANFLYLSVNDYPQDYHARLAANHILGGRMVEEEGRWARITIGTGEEMKAYIRALQ